MAELAIVLTARPSYAKLKPVIQACLDIDLYPDIYVCASALLTRYGNVHAQVRQDFPSLLTIPVYSVFEGGELVSSVLSTGALTSALGHEFSRRRPQLVVVMADRHETLGASIAASYQNIPVAHLQGGEVSGNIDNKVRNANTMLADYHFPATYRAAEHVSLLKFDMTPAWDQDHIFMYGCPSIDVARIAQTQHPVTDEELGGDGEPMDLSKPFFTVLYHPETEESHLAYSDTTNLLYALNQQPIPLVVFWPGQDAGMEGSSKAIREFKHRLGPPLRTVRTLPPERFLRLMAQTRVLFGNSSTGIRECSYLGTPVVNVGERQYGRERASNVRDVASLEWPWIDSFDIRRRPSSTLYGDGHASPKIAATLKELLCR